jgi:hypothetical protein
MITETQPCVSILQLTDALAEQLQPFLTGLDTTVAPPRLMMRSEVYEALAERVGSALDYDVRWQPNEYEPDGFVERVRPLELSYGILVASSCAQCRVQLLANRAEVMCVCGQAIYLPSQNARTARYVCIRPPLFPGFVLLTQKRRQRLLPLPPIFMPAPGIVFTDDPLNGTLRRPGPM